MRVIHVLAGTASILVAACLSGCEGDATDSTESTLSVTPGAAYLSASVITVFTFTATGGDSNYTWSVSDADLGTLHTASGIALYQSTTNVGTNTITVVDGSSGIGSATVIQR
jgi:hypothetical protein